MGGGSCEKLPSKYDQYIEYIQGQATLNMQDVGEYDQAQLYTVLYGPLGENEYYEFTDLNNDGKREVYKATTDAEGNQQIITVYGRDDEFQTTETSYDDWLEQNQPEDEELRAKTDKYANDLNDALGGVVDVQKVSDSLYNQFGPGSPMPEPTESGPTLEVEVFDCLSNGGTWDECTTLGIILKIPGIPNIPILGTIFKDVTLKEIKDLIVDTGTTIKDVVTGECAPEKEIEDPDTGEMRCPTLVDIVLNKIGEKADELKTIFDQNCNTFTGEGCGITVEDILKTVGGYVGDAVFGAVLTSAEDAVRDKIGLPIIPEGTDTTCTGSLVYDPDANNGLGGCVESGTTTGFGICEDLDEFGNEVVKLDADGSNCPGLASEWNPGDPCTTGLNPDIQNDGKLNELGKCIPNPIDETTDGDGGDDTAVTPEEQDCENQGKVYSPDEKKCVNRKNKCPDPLREVDYLTGECKDECTDGSLANKHVDGKCWQPLKTDVDDTGECPEGTVACPEGTFNINDGSSCSSNPEVECKKRGDDTPKPPPVDGYDCKGNPQTFEEEKACIEQGWAECGSSTQNPGRWYRSSVGEAKACGTTVTPPMQCNDPNAVNNGEDGPCECKPGYSKDTEGMCVENVCNNGTTIESGCQECPSGQDFDADGNCGPIYECDDPNATVNADGSCGPCKQGYVFDGAVERCVQESVTDPCDDPAYAAANPTECGSLPPDCTDCSCAEYAAANPDECGTGGGGDDGGGDDGSTGGGVGMFRPQASAPPSLGDPQLLARTEFPIVDYLSESLAQQTKGELMQGMLTGNIV
jgi:hypothetical protein